MSANKPNVSLNKSVLTNVVAAAILLGGWLTHNEIVMWVGLFALSGALTNWLAIHMLFEKVPGLIGSGVIPNRFEAFKSAIQKMMMEQFFTQENIERFMVSNTGSTASHHLTPILEKVDLSPAFDKLVKVIMESSFGGMLGMFGGQEALTPLKEPFMLNMKESLIEMTESDTFAKMLQAEMGQSDVMSGIREKVAGIIEARLDELTPAMVKVMVQDMIKEHLGWLVVWGGVFGGAIGLVSALLIG